MRPLLRLLAAALLVLLPAVAQAQVKAPRWFSSPGLGLFVTSINDALVHDLGLARAQGGLVIAVVRGSAGDLAGIKPGDIVTAWAPDAVWSQDGKAGTVRIVRNRQEQTLRVTSKKIGNLAEHELLRMPAPARAARKVIVDPAGKGDYRTITAALVRAVPGDEIVLNAGHYAEGVLLVPGVSVHGIERTLVSIEPEILWYLPGPGEIALSQLSFTGMGVGFDGADKVSISDCAITVAPKRTAIFADKVKSLEITKSAISGATATTGLAAYGSTVSVSNSTFNNHGQAAIQLFRGSQAKLSTNYLTGNIAGIEAYSSTLDARGNVLTGTFDPDAKSKAEVQDHGIWLSKSQATLVKNVVRRHEYGYFVTAAPAPVKITEATATQGRWGIALIGSPAEIRDSLVLQNLSDGVYISNPAKDAPPGPLSVSLTRNTISGNGRDGVDIQKFHSVTLRENLVESNGVGVYARDSTANLQNNTVVLQHATGVLVNGSSDVEIFNNIVAFNSYGLLLDVAAKRATGYNDVYGNLASKSFPLRDGNYARADRYTTRDGKKVRLEIYPAYDLKVDTDLSVDPGFVKTGSDYSLKADSALAGKAGRNTPYLGAYEPGQ